MRLAIVLFALAACTGTHPTTCDLDCGSSASCVVTAGVPGCLCLKIGQTSCLTEPYAFACVDLSQNVQNCGACGNACLTNETCVDGTCTCALPLLFLEDAGYFCGEPHGCAFCLQPSQVMTCCGSSCTDLRSDSQNCGACGSECGDAGYCANSACVCPDGLIACPPPSGRGSICLDPRADPDNCGVCGAFCGAYEECVDGDCECRTGAGVATCTNDAGVTTCSELATDALNCGDCNQICASGEQCVDGGCDCVAHKCPVDGGFSCIDLVNWGADAGDPCDRHFCLGCAPNAPPGQPTCCNGACTIFDDDPFNCGACGNVCDSGICSGNDAGVGVCG